MDLRVKPAGDGETPRSILFVIAGHSASKTRVNALMTRQSIRFARSSCEERWTRGSSPRVTYLDSAGNRIARSYLPPRPRDRDVDENLVLLHTRLGRIGGVDE